MNKFKIFMVILIGLIYTGCKSDCCVVPDVNKNTGNEPISTVDPRQETQLTTSQPINCNVSISNIKNQGFDINSSDSNYPIIYVFTSNDNNISDAFEIYQDSRVSPDKPCNCYDDIWVKIITVDNCIVKFDLLNQD